MKILWISYYFYPFTGVGPNKNTLLVEQISNTNDVMIISASPNSFNSKQEYLSKENKKYKNHIAIPSFDNQILFSKFRKQNKKTTQKSNNIQVKKSKSSFLKSLVGFVDYQNSWYLFWKIYKYFYLNKIKNFNPDIIYISAPSFISILIGKELKKILNIPLAVEYRDLWTGTHHYKKNNFIKKCEYKIEKKLVNDIDLFLFATDGIRKTHSKIFHTYQKSELLYNFFINNEIYKNDSLTNQKEIVFIYSGTLYNQVYDYEIFLDGLKTLLNDNISFKVKIYSGNGQVLKDIIQNSYQELLIYFEFSYETNIVKLAKIHQNADFNIIFTWNSGYKGVVPSKSFFYLQFNKPVLVIGHYEEKELKLVLNNIYYYINKKNRLLDIVTKNSYIKNDNSYIQTHSLSYRAKQLEEYLKKGIKNYESKN